MLHLLAKSNPQLPNPPEMDSGRLIGGLTHVESYSRANFMPLFSHSQTLMVDLWSSSVPLGNALCDSLGSGLSGLASSIGYCGRTKTRRKTSLLPQTVVFPASCSLS